MDEFLLFQISFDLHATSIQLQRKNCKQVLQDLRRTFENADPYKAIAVRIVKGYLREDASCVTVKGI